jgi:hypothetical protein
LFLNIFADFCNCHGPGICSDSDAVGVQALFAVGDINNDGEIDINEFINVMCPAATTVITRISSSFSGLQDIKVSHHCHHQNQLILLWSSGY